MKASTLLAGALPALLGTPAAAQLTLDDSLAAVEISPGCSNLLVEDKRLPDQRFTIGIAAGLMKFDTNVRFTSKTSSASLFVDGEGTLGLPETQVIPLIYSAFAFSERHAISLAGFRIDRQSTLLDTTLAVGDYTVTGRADLADRSAFYHLNYKYTFTYDERSRVGLAVGLYGIDLSYRLDLAGEIAVDGIPIEEDTLSRSASVFAPLPMLGLDASFALSSRWSLGTKLTFVGGAFQGVSGTVLDTSVRTRWAFSQHVALDLGVSYFDADLTIDQDELDTDVSYGFDGIYAGLAMSF